MDAFRQLGSLLAASIHSIQLKRGDTLKLEHGAGATMHLAYGGAYLSDSRRTRCIGEGETVPFSDKGTILIYALQDSSVRLDGPELCSMELRRRGEVAWFTIPRSS
jgi:hypothetical protein